MRTRQYTLLGSLVLIAVALAIALWPSGKKHHPVCSYDNDDAGCLVVSGSTDNDGAR